MFSIGTTCICTTMQPDGTKVTTHVKVLDHREGDLIYIHHEGCDTRLDEWVHIDRLSILSEPEISSHPKRRRLPSSSPRSELGSDEDLESNRKIWHHGAGHGEEHTKVRNIQKIQLGEHLIDAWYYSPYPAPYDKFVEKLFICEETFKYMKSSKVFLAHRNKRDELKKHSPPGVEIYHDNKLSVFRVEGAKERLYCQNLCLLGKLFIEHKTLHFDPNPFYFFLITERYELNGGTRYRPVGYFSKEKDSPDGYNLACILTLPPFQRCGYGKFIISLSYELSKREGKLGSPEKPLSDLGKLSYRSFWSCRLLMLLKEACDTGARPGVHELAKQTGIRVEDTISTLQPLGFIKHLRRSFVLAVTPEQIETLLEPFLKKRYMDSFCRPDCFIME